jgi:hypothetical protein
MINYYYVIAVFLVVGDNLERYLTDFADALYSSTFIVGADKCRLATALPEKRGICDPYCCTWQILSISATSAVRLLRVTVFGAFGRRIGRRIR